MAQFLPKEEQRLLGETVKNKQVTQVLDILYMIMK
jgi:hypothetical protein